MEQSYSRLSWLWWLMQICIGWTWLSEGIEKAQSPGWLGLKAGSSLAAWIAGAATRTQGAHAGSSGRYDWFLSTVVLPHVATWSYLITFVQIGVGVGLILGLFTGVAALFGTTMNVGYLLAGTATANPVIFAMGVLLVVAWPLDGRTPSLATQRVVTRPRLRSR